MIKFDRKESAVIAIITLDIPGAKSWNYSFQLQENNIPTAQLVFNAIDDQLKEKLKQIREDAYTSGWADAKAKRKKTDWFGGWW